MGGRRGASFCFGFLFGLEVIGPNIFTHKFFHGSPLSAVDLLQYVARDDYTGAHHGGVSPAPVTGGLSAVRPR